MFNRIKYFIQRGKRGISDRDLWGLYDYLCDILPPAIRHYKKGLGCPSEFYDKKNINNECQKWADILEEMAQGFEAAKQMDMPQMKWIKKDKWEEEVDKLKYKQLSEKYDRGMKLFTKYFLALWD